MSFKRIVIAKPPIGGKAHTIRENGWHVLEEVPGLIWHCICSHAGTKGISIWDGYVDPDGSIVKVREIFTLEPSLLGVWHLNAGFQFGLIAKVPDDHGGMGPAMTLVWMTKSVEGEAKKLQQGERKTQTISVAGHEDKFVVEKDIVLYQVQVTRAGAGTIRLYDGEGRELFQAPGGIAGSFVLEHVYCKGGLRYVIDTPVTATLTLTWFETV